MVSTVARCFPTLIGVLQGTGKLIRHITIRKENEPDRPFVRRYLQAAIEQIGALRDGSRMVGDSSTIGLRKVASHSGTIAKMSVTWPGVAGATRSPASTWFIEPGRGLSQSQIHFSSRSMAIPFWVFGRSSMVFDDEPPITCMRVHCSQTELCQSTRSLALSCADKPSGSFVEGLLMVPHTEQISRAFVEGGDRGVPVHPAHRAETFVGGETVRFGVDQ